jgi:hypothetical protein
MHTSGQENHPGPPVEDTAGGAFTSLRERALTATRAQVGLDAATKPTTPWAVIMEMGMESASVALVALSDGTASLYFSNGGGFIGGGAHESIRVAARTLVTLAAKFQPGAALMKKFPLPKHGQVTFYLRTDDGVFTMSAMESEFGEKRHTWAPLFNAGQKVISEYRLIEEAKK